MPRPDRLDAYVARLVRRMPSDLTRRLAELEQAGELDPVLERVFARYAVAQATSDYAAGLLRAELTALLPDVIGPFRAAVRT